jgi:hypothetical protein
LTQLSSFETSAPIAIELKPEGKSFISFYTGSAYSIFLEFVIIPEYSLDFANVSVIGLAIPLLDTVTRAFLFFLI